MNLKRMTTAVVSTALLVGILGGAALAQTDDDVMSPMETMAAETAALVVEGAWSRPSPMAEGTGVAYMRLVNRGDADDALIGASTPAAEVVEMHETAADAEGMMSMTPVESIAVGAGSETELAPGGYHLMLIGLVEPLMEGEVIELTLEFEHAGSVPVSADVLGMDAAGPVSDMDMDEGDMDMDEGDMDDAGMDQGVTETPAP